jgi:hypothetical protein
VTFLGPMDEALLRAAEERPLASHEREALVDMVRRLDREAERQLEDKRCLVAYASGGAV